MGALFMQKLKEGNAMTDVHCDNKSCLNNRKGWCGAKGVRVNKQQRCTSYAEPCTLLRGVPRGRVRRDQGKYKSVDVKVYR